GGDDTCQSRGAAEREWTMNLGAALLTLLDSLRPILERWPLVVLAIVLVTLLGIPARILVGALAKLLRVPADYTRTEIDPLLRRANPTLPNRLLRNLRDYFRPVLDRPARALGRHEKAVGAQVSFLPEWFREITLAYAIASFVGALTLGLVFFDLIGMTHLGPWDDLEPRRRLWLSRVALALAVCFLLLSLF